MSNKYTSAIFAASAMWASSAFAGSHPQDVSTTTDKSRAVEIRYSAQSDIGPFVAERDYPARALKEKRQGTTGYRVTVGTDGRAQNCMIIKSSGHADLDEQTCRSVVRRGRFNPALDADGNPIMSEWSGEAVWMISEDILSANE